MIPFQTGPVIAVAGKGGRQDQRQRQLAVAFARLRWPHHAGRLHMGPANAAILLGMPSAWTIGDLISGRCGSRSAPRPGGCNSCPAIAAPAATDPSAERGRLLEALRPYAARYDHIVIDTGGGIEASSFALVAAADTPLIVLTPELTRSSMPMRW